MKSSTAIEPDLNQMVHEKEAEANIVIAKLLMILGAVCLLYWVGYIIGLWTTVSLFDHVVALGDGLLLILVSAICLHKKGAGKATKFLLFAPLLLLLFGANISSDYQDWMLFAFPIILTCRYFNTQLTVVIFVISEVEIFVSAVINAFFYNQVGYMDLNTVSFGSETTIKTSGFLHNAVVAAQPDSLQIFQNTLRNSTITHMIMMVILLVTCLTLQKFFRRVLLEYGNMSRQKAEMELEVANSRSRIMLSQIQPHFLYNALQAIMAIDGNPDETIDAIGDFGKYLRENLDVITSGDMVPFQKELVHVQRYVSLEELRFGDKIKVDYNIQTENFEIPAMTVQMIVENAIKHGISKKQDGGFVHVQTREEKDAYVIIVEDNGLGFDKTKGKPQDGRSHVGLENIEARLRNLCNGTFEINSTVGVGTIAIVRIPR